MPKETEPAESTVTSGTDKAPAPKAATRPSERLRQYLADQKAKKASNKQPEKKKRKVIKSSSLKKKAKKGTPKGAANKSPTGKGNGDQVQDDVEINDDSKRKAHSMYMKYWRSMKSS